MGDQITVPEVLTPVEGLALLRRIRDKANQWPAVMGYSPEEGHIHADAVLQAVLRGMGGIGPEIADTFEDVARWYA